MKTFRLPSSHLRFAAFAAIVVAAAPARAVTIDFESYSPGPVAGQPATPPQWVTNSGLATAFNVNATAGVGGTFGLQLVDVDAFAKVRLSPTFAGFDAAASQVEFSFALAKSTAAGAGAPIFRFRTGDTEDIMRLEFSNDGRFFITNGNGSGGVTSTVVAKTTTGGSTDFVSSAGVFFTVAGTIDYGTKSFAISVNGVNQEVSGGNPNFGFVNNSSLTSSFTLSNLSNDANFSSVTLDNITYSAIPEPHSVALLGGAAVLLLVATRRRGSRS